MKAIRVTDPTIEPISLEDVKLHVKANDDITIEDEYFEGLIVSARENVENITRRAVLTQTWDYYLDDWPKENWITLPFGNLQSVPETQSIKWKDADGTETTLTIMIDYIWEMNGSQCGRVVLPYAVPWPSGTLYPSNPITICFVCGWTTADLVPYSIRAAIKMIATDLYQNRESQMATSPSNQGYVVNETVQNLLASYRLWNEF